MEYKHRRCVEANIIRLGNHQIMDRNTVMMEMVHWVVSPRVRLFGSESISNLRVAYLGLKTLYISHLVSNDLSL
tara:strand:+ start:389 stop:610 length:222 start_codon:yes stop_codon:yes gene_type:complete